MAPPIPGRKNYKLADAQFNLAAPHQPQHTVKRVFGSIGVGRLPRQNQSPGSRRENQPQIPHRTVVNHLRWLAGIQALTA